MDSRFAQRSFGMRLIGGQFIQRTICLWILIAGCVSFLLLNIETIEAADDLGELKSLVVQISESQSNPRAFDKGKKLPAEFGNADQFASLLEQGIREFDEPEHKIICLKILAEKLTKNAKSVLVNLAANEQLDQTTRLHAIHLVTLYRDPELLPFFEKLLDHQELQLRIAGLDAIGYLRQPCLRIGGFSPSLETTPPIQLRALIGSPSHGIHPQHNGYNSQLISKQREFRFAPETNARLHQRFVDTMLGAKNASERQAAARGLVEWIEPEDELRVAEWGVWISNSENEFQLVKSVLDEIPAFVTRTQNLVDDLRKDRVTDLMFITKPVVHFTASKPMSIDFTVDIAMGQTWFAYPEPSDFHLMTSIGFISDDKEGFDGLTGILMQPFRDTLQEQNPMGPFTFDDGHLGYPWMDNPHKFGSTSGSMGAKGNMVMGVGLTWENLIIAPERYDAWMHLESVLKKRKWWSDLRQVNSDWVSNGEQTERFLYYDGPTLAKSPVTIAQNETRITISYAYQNELERFQRGNNRRGFEDPCQVMLINVKDGKPRASHWSSFRQIEIDLEKVQWPDEPGTFAAFGDLVGSHNGLTPAESSGILQAWQQQFFETDGTRLLVRINQNQYDLLCPLEIRPEPTEISRVGLILYELDAVLPKANDVDGKVEVDAKAVIADEQNDEADNAAVTLQRRNVSRARQIVEQRMFERLSNCSPEVRQAVFDIFLTTPMMYQTQHEWLSWNRTGEQEKIFELLFGDDADFARRNAFIQSFMKAVLPLDSPAYAQRQFHLALQWCLQFIHEGATLPPEFPPKVALLIASNQVALDFAQRQEAADWLTEYVLKKLDEKLPANSEALKSVEEDLTRRILSDECLSTHQVSLQIACALLPPESASQLFQLALDTARKVGQKSDPQEKNQYRMAEVLEIAEHLAAHVDPNDSEKFQRATIELRDLKLFVRFRMPFNEIVNHLRKDALPADAAKQISLFLDNFGTEKEEPIEQILSLFPKLDAQLSDKLIVRLLEMARAYSADDRRLFSLAVIGRVLPDAESSAQYTHGWLELGKAMPEGSARGVFLSTITLNYKNADNEDKAFMRAEIVENVRRSQGVQRLRSFVNQRGIVDLLTTEELTDVKRLIEEVQVDPSDQRSILLKQTVLRDLVQIENLRASQK
jgi:hypothetical protein